MRWDINWGEHYISKPEWELDGTWTKLIYRSSEIDGRETRPGRRWDTNVGTRMELRCEPSDPDGGRVLHGRKWCKYIGISIQMRQDLHGVETYLETWVSLRWCLLEWDAILRTWMEVRRTSLNLDELEMVPGWSWDAICGPGWRWDVTKMEVKWKYKDIDWGEVLPGWGGEVNLQACMEVGRPGRGWDGTRTELRQISWDLNKLWWD